MNLLDSLIRWLFANGSGISLFVCLCSTTACVPREHDEVFISPSEKEDATHSGAAMNARQHSKGLKTTHAVIV